jgi:hypothetical protein
VVRQGGGKRHNGVGGCVWDDGGRVAVGGRVHSGGRDHDGGDEGDKGGRMGFLAIALGRGGGVGVGYLGWGLLERWEEGEVRCVLVFFRLFFHTSAVAAAGPLVRATLAAVVALVEGSFDKGVVDMAGGGGGSWGGAGGFSRG